MKKVVSQPSQEDASICNPWAVKRDPAVQQRRANDIGKYLGTCCHDISCLKGLHGNSHWIMNLLVEETITTMFPKFPKKESKLSDEFSGCSLLTKAHWKKPVIKGGDLLQWNFVGKKMGKPSIYSPRAS